MTEQELQKVWEENTLSISDSLEKIQLRAIGLDTLKSLINISYTNGKKDGIKECNELVSNIPEI